ncbi:MAG: hypothetical protein A3B38_00455 [Candidatus Levybacteria bacterium RIFCSPLOWO2_01_FULL_36_13]|nr:MAG: hypothetical protein A2684_01695 [Candidatus Levybacteria bacterium RIFCSPHIGHO2_01_FULL_36_15b]OGH35360.1 MAG: hypothetical protein A3B38_00455 [Candidatus Levybacteria bacterium RIFCSPLOWO2_01_FULL_36_13]
MFDSPERIKGDIPALEYADLINPTSRYEPLLYPSSIPIHPQVYNAEKTYTDAFADEVYDALLGSIRKDDAIIRNMLKRDTELTIENDTLTWKGKPFSLESFYFDIDPNMFAVDIVGSANAQNIRIDKRDPSMLHSHPGLTIPMEKQIQYRSDPDEPYMLRWHTHNLANLAYPEELVFRNIAILVNNLGLRKIT